MGKDCFKAATLAAQALHYVDPATGGLVPAIQPSTTFARDDGYALINPAHTYGARRHSGLPSGRGAAVRA
jgi:cystathionine gamma-synthase